MAQLYRALKKQVCITGCCSWVGQWVSMRECEGVDNHSILL